MGHSRSRLRETTMKKLTVLSATLCLAIFGMSSQANTETNTPADTELPMSDQTEQVDESQAEQEDTPPAAPVVSPQVAKLIQWYPNLVARIEPYGRVCFEGGECDITISVLSASADGSPRDGATIYKAVCHTCHDAGLVGAPKFGDTGAWAARIAQGKDTLYNHAINGYNAMPPKGGADIPDEEVQNAVDYIVQKSS